ncbi:MAG TPA: chemotaxis protein CheC [Deltaproteobacteria bacterium]|nr:chemotaxis protein CheC [Deltaproteobacteria bacterium]
MELEKGDGLSADEIEVLQEIVNIAFGKASADLADLLDHYLVLTVPRVTLVKSRDIPAYIRNEVSCYSNGLSIVEQRYWGKFKGVALLVFPSKAGKELVSLLGADDEIAGHNRLDTLEREALVEVGNILIGACIGKIAELLRDIVTYSPPTVMVQTDPLNTMPIKLDEPEAHSVILRTVFSFEGRDLSGALFIMPSRESAWWLKLALNDFLDNYE